jgi:hypothetical protein
MKRFVRELGPEARREWRRWQGWWICFYTVIVVALIGIGSLAPRSDGTELAQSLSINQNPAVKQPGMSARVGLR